MQPEFPKIDFKSQAEVWSNADHRRAEEISGWLKLAFGSWMTSLNRRRQSIFEITQYATASARTGERRRASSRS
jgi:hypothetical protein